MQLRLRPRSNRSTSINKLLVKGILFISIFFLAIFLLDKIKMPVPSKLIKQAIPNDKIITLK
tara:strand:- start:401 stop:586 length:186 start_codon:yes stop_codon:yes gene_type:complete